MTRRQRDAETERVLDAMANDGRLVAIAKRLAVGAGFDWLRLDEEAQDAWCELAIEHVRADLKRPRKAVKPRSEP